MSSNRKRRTPYAKILRAARMGRGLRLTFAEVMELATDHAIRTVALMDLGEAEPEPSSTELREAWRDNQR